MCVCLKTVRHTQLKTDVCHGLDKNDFVELSTNARIGRYLPFRYQQRGGRRGREGIALKRGVEERIGRVMQFSTCLPGTVVMNSG